jgi:hypothetical protein
MHKASELAACLAVWAAMDSVAQPRGVFEPWTSRTDPTEAPKRHVQDVTTSPFTYTIIQGGTIDGKMCTTLPGVWEPYEQTWESSRSIHMENVGDVRVINPWLKIGPIDFFSQQTLDPDHLNTNDLGEAFAIKTQAFVFERAGRANSVARQQPLNLPAPSWES